MLLARPARLRLSLSAAALLGLGGLAAAQDAVDPGLPLDAGYEGIAGEGEFPLLLGSVREGAAPAAVRMIRGGRVVAAGTLDETGGLEPGALPPGVYSVAGEAAGGRAVFAYKVVEGEVSTTGPAPLRLVAPAADWPVARAILMRRFPQLAAPVPTPGAVPATAPAPAAPIGGPVPPPAALPAPIPVRTISKVTVDRRMGGVRPGSRGLVTQFDAAGVARPIVGADIYLIRAGERVAETRTDDGGLFTLPATLGGGIHTLVTVSNLSNGVSETLGATAVLRGNATRMAGASVVGLDIDAAAPAPVPAADPAVPAADPAVPVVRAADGFVRPAALRAVQGGADFAVAQVPAADLGFALPVGPGGDDPGLAGAPPFGPAGGPGGFGGGGGLGGGGAAGGGGLLGALAIGGIAAGVIAAVSDDDEEPVAVADDPSANTPPAPAPSSDP